MAFNSLSGTIIGPDKIVAKPDGTFTQLTGTISGSYIDADGNAVSFSEIGNAGVIGAAEDGDYTDGLFTDFAEDTTIGVPIDRFNELFKSLVPPPAPDVSSVSASQDGTDVYLSFGSSNTITGYENVGTGAGFSAVDKDGLYETATTGDNFRQSVFKLDTNITGEVNFDEPASILGTQPNQVTNHVAKAFGNADTGLLQLWVNGSKIHETDLSSFTGAGNPGAGTGTDLTSNSGFTNISITKAATDANSNTFQTFKHRTANFIVHTDAQRNGWNYVQIKHVIGSTEKVTNFIEWVNDNNSVNPNITNLSISNVALNGSIV